MKSKIVIALAGVMLLTTPTWGNEPSDWAVESVTSAYELGLVPDKLMDNYTQEVTRGEFCSLCATTLRACGIEAGTGETTFTDTTDSDVALCASLGIVSGMGNGRFEPDRTITRQEAARLLTGTLWVINDNRSDSLYLPHIFNDGEDISQWARQEIYAAYHTGVMQGVSHGNFDPMGSYTREQAIATMYRLYNLKDTSDLNINKEYYPYGSGAAAVKQNRDIGGNSYYIDRAYSRNEADFALEYIDSEGKAYTAKELGYTYPVGSEYMPVLTSQGVGATAYTFINYEGDDVASGSSISVVYDIEDNIAQVMAQGPKLFDLSKGQLLSLTGSSEEMVTSVGCGMYMVFTGEGSFFINSNLQPVTEPVYRYGNVHFVNNLAAVRRLDGSFDVINTEGKVLKHFTVDMDKYSDINEIFGTNISLVYANGEGYDILRAVSGEYITGYSMVELLEDGCILAVKSGIDYLLDPSGNVKFCISDRGYIELVYTKGFYMGRNSSGWDLLDTNGELLLSGFSEGYLITDGGGIYCGRSNEDSLMCFDATGYLLGTVPCGKNATWDNCCFINGLIRVANGEELIYSTPEGNRVEFIK